MDKFKALGQELAQRRLQSQMDVTGKYEGVIKFHCIFIYFTAFSANKTFSHSNT